MGVWWAAGGRAKDLADFLAEMRCHVIASLPCYSAKNVNMQRGSGVFDRSLQGLLTLNEVCTARPRTPPHSLPPHSRSHEHRSLPE